ncbi:MAG: ABC transporter substrate-binding protein, partial [Dehalococcoidia bacterium]|nr:ABC transporter substrate-binding protein [Dehalococcoidia bacterium]
MVRHRLFRVPFLIAVLTATMLVVAVACGSSAEPTTAPPAQAPSSGSSATSVPVPTSAPTVPAVVKPTGKLTIAITDMGNETPTVWQEFAFGKAYMRFLYDALTGTNDAGEVDKTTGAAEEWSMSPDARKWTFILRDNIKFHNGDQLTAEDAKFSIGLVMSEDSITSYKGTVKAAIADQDSMTVVSPTELVIDTSTASGFLNWFISDIQGVEGLIQPKNYTESVGNDEFAKNPVGSGPYKWVDQRKGDFMEMEALDNHWRDGAPRFKTVLWRIIPEESTRIAALKAGEVDVISVSRERAPQLKADGLNIFSKEGASVLGLYFHEQWRDNSVWKDINVRKAFNLAI